MHVCKSFSLFCPKKFPVFCLFAFGVAGNLRGAEVSAFDQKLAIFTHLNGLKGGAIRTAVKFVAKLESAVDGSLESGIGGTVAQQVEVVTVGDGQAGYAADVLEADGVLDAVS